MSPGYGEKSDISLTRAVTFLTTEANAEVGAIREGKGDCVAAPPS